MTDVDDVTFARDEFGLRLGSIMITRGVRDWLACSDLELPEDAAPAPHGWVDPPRHPHFRDQREDRARCVTVALSCFLRGDWGDTPPEDVPLNDAAKDELPRVSRILASYAVPQELQSREPRLGTADRIWIINEVVGPRHELATTILFPSDY